MCANITKGDYADNINKKHSPVRHTRASNLILRRDVGYVTDDTIQGEVISIVGNQAIVEAIVNGELLDVNCVPAGTIISSNKHSNLIATGDVVFFQYNPQTLSKIVKIAYRKTKLSRISPANRNKEQIIAANIDTLLIFVSTFEPMLNTRLIDRYLIVAKINSIEPIICVNKIELSNRQMIYQILSAYKKCGIKIHYISALNNKGLQTIKNKLLTRKTVISGPSGVGKSTFLNAILGYPAQAVSEISNRTQKGIHTTSFSKRYNLSNAGWIIDTPGLREFGIWDVSQDELGVLFPDFTEYYLHCKFTSCTHTHEPGCAVIEAVNSGKIEGERYLSYLNLLETLNK